MNTKKRVSLTLVAVMMLCAMTAIASAAQADQSYRGPAYVAADGSYIIYYPWWNSNSSTTTTAQDGWVYYPGYGWYQQEETKYPFSGPYPPSLAEMPNRPYHPIDDYVIYTDKSGVTPSTATVGQKSPLGYTISTTKGSTKVYDSGDTGANHIDTLASGTPIELMYANATGNWYRILYNNNGNAGWIQASHVN